MPEMTELIFRFTPEEVKVLQALIEFHSGSEIPDWLSEDAYDSVFDKFAKHLLWFDMLYQ